ncbi:hypothetical protein [Tautonia plasticadhaerens]|uniref:Uncharacterized protein n=1 Tax=Tautonia plasticadhaerens TaxID=2527974 RepID=A0A518H863_9BACT|nr:hypothetical protein [Tautonia plasticadhaerens]QDV37047.1 hypothetical protein ElP_49800 [Tautonia plasticadhaerens]
MTARNTPDTSTPTPPGPASEALQPIGPRIYGESAYDRVTSLLMAVIIGSVIVVGWLGLIYLTNQSYAKNVPAEIRIIEVFGGGGTPEGEEDSTERVDVSDAAAAAFASNSELSPADFEEPAVQQTPSAMVEALADEQFADLAEEMPQGGAVATGIRASKLGSGAASYGLGGGDGGVPREQRWSILYNPGQTLDEYARLLDFFGVEMATVLDGQMHYAANFTKARPDVRVTNRGNDERLYFLWQGGGRRQSDIELLRKAGIAIGPREPIFQFFPDQVEQILARLEQQYKGLQPAEIRTTRFTVVPAGNRYAFEVIDQQPLN